MGRKPDPNLLAKTYGCLRALERLPRTNTTTMVRTQCMNCGNIAARPLTNLKNFKSSYCRACPKSKEDRSPLFVLVFGEYAKVIMGTDEAEVLEGITFEERNRLTAAYKGTAAEAFQIRLNLGTTPQDTNPIKEPAYLVPLHAWVNYFQDPEAFENRGGGEKAWKELDLPEDCDNYTTDKQLEEVTVIWTSSPGPGGKVWVYPQVLNP